MSEIVGPGQGPALPRRRRTPRECCLLPTFATASITGVTITKGKVTGSDDGGGISNLGDLKLYGVHVTDNEGRRPSGGVWGRHLYTGQPTPRREHC